MNSRSERVKPNYGTRYYIPSITNGFLSELHYWGDEPQFDEIVFNRGLVFLDEDGMVHVFWWASSIEEAILNYKEGTIISSDISRLSCNLILETNEDIENILDKYPELLI